MTRRTQRAVAGVVSAIALAASVVAGGRATAEPEPDRLCVFAGYNPYVFVEHCFDVPDHDPRTVPDVTGSTGDLPLP